MGKGVLGLKTTDNSDLLMEAEACKAQQFLRRSAQTYVEEKIWQ